MLVKISTRTCCFRHFSVAVRHLCLAAEAEAEVGHLETPVAFNSHSAKNFNIQGLIDKETKRKFILYLFVYSFVSLIFFPHNIFQLYNSFEFFIKRLKKTHPNKRYIYTYINFTYFTYYFILKKQFF